MKRYIVLSLIILLIFSLTIGCAPARRVEDNPNRVADPNTGTDPNLATDPNRVNDGNLGTPGNMVPNNQGDNTTLPRNNATDNTTGNDETRARRIADIAQDVDGVRNATVVVTGETAYVGIDMDANLENEETNRLKDRVGDRIKDREDTINRVLVSADADTVTRLREMGQDIRGGRPISGFVNELTEMFRRPTPTVQ